MVVAVASSVITPPQACHGLRARFRSLVLFILALMVGPNVAIAEIIWSGDFSTGNFMQYHVPDDANKVAFWWMPAYGAPPETNLGPGEDYVYGPAEPSEGDGSLLSLVTSPTRGSRYSAKFTVKNAQSGSEPRDCDPVGATCDRRRVQLQMFKTLPDYYDALPYRKTRWISLSIFLPADYPVGGSGFGPVILGSKPRNDKNGQSGHLQIQVDGSQWQIYHRWAADNPDGQVPWQQAMFYTADYPSEEKWPDGLRDFPSADAQAALGSLNLGGWTDWIIKTNNDARGSREGGEGFITVWKREDNGLWVRVLHIVPKVTTRGGMTFDHGIGYHVPPINGNNGGYGVSTGVYMSKEQVWDQPQDKVIYLANHKIGDENTTFVEMSPDGSAPSVEATDSSGETNPVVAAPMPPALDQE